MFLQLFPRVKRVGNLVAPNESSMQFLSLILEKQPRRSRAATFSSQNTGCLGHIGIRADETLQVSPNISRLATKYSRTRVARAKLTV